MVEMGGQEAEEWRKRKEGRMGRGGEGGREDDICGGSIIRGNRRRSTTQ